MWSVANCILLPDNKMNAHKNYRSLVIIAIYFYILCYVVWCILLDMRFPRSLTVSLINKFQEQPSRDVLMKRYSENMQQIYRRTSIPKCNFNKVAIKIALRHGCSPVNVLHIFGTLFTKNISKKLLLILQAVEICWTQFQWPWTYSGPKSQYLATAVPSVYLKWVWTCLVSFTNYAAQIWLP